MPRRSERILFLAVIVQVSLGSIYTWSVFANPLASSFSLSKSTVSLVFSVVLMSYALGVLIGGNLQIRVPPEHVALGGSLAFCFGYLMASQVSTLVGLFILYGGFAGIGAGIGYNGVIGLCLRAFPQKKGFASGIALAGFGMGSLIFAPLSTFIIQYAGWRSAFLIGGLVHLVLAVGGSSHISKEFRKTDPLENTEVPDVTNETNLAWREMLFTRDFWLLWTLLFLTASSGLMVIAHLTDFLSLQGLTLAEAGLAVGVLGILNGGSRIGWGSLSDRIGGLLTLRYVALLLVIATAGFP